MIITASHVAKHLEGVTDEMIGKCHKAFDLVDGKAIGFYLVENSQGELDQDGEVIEYRVTYDAKGFHCTCKSGKVGFANVKHPSGVCQHVRSSMAAEAEMKQAVADLEAASEEAALAERERKAETDSDPVQAFYAQEAYRQSAQEAFMMALPSRQAARKA